MRYTALVDGKSGAYGVVFPDILGCNAMGKTVEEALAHAAEVLREFADDLGPALPPPRPIEALLADSVVAGEIAEGAVLASVPLVRATGKPVKANISIDEGVLAALDEEAGRRQLTRSALIELLAREGLPMLA